MTREVSLALALIREGGEAAAAGCQVGNSVAGSLLSLVHHVPRQYAEPAVVEALWYYRRQLKRRKVAPCLR